VRIAGRVAEGGDQAVQRVGIHGGLGEAAAEVLLTQCSQG
jgi:hypothetical protein